MTLIKRVSACSGSETIQAILDQDGCIVIEDILDADMVQKLRSELQPHLDQTANCQGDFYGYVTKRLSSLIAKSKGCQLMAIHPTILDIMDRFLLTGCRDYQLNLTQAISIGPGEPQQMIHPDDLMFPFSHPGHEAMINTMWAIDEFTLENGATHVVPGSHKWPKDRMPEPSEIVQATMKPGSVLIYFASLLHGGGANRSEQPRLGVVLSYCYGWLRQAENQYLAVPQTLAATLPERLQKLLGYFVHEPNLGCVEGQDPIRLLKGETLINSGFTEFLPDEVKPLLAEHRARQAA